MNIRRGRNEPPSARPDPMKSWRNASPVIRGTPVDHYLRSRGNALTDKEAVSLRFSPALWHWPTQTKWPTMLARVSLASGEVLAVHQTFLEARRLRQGAAGGQGAPFCGRRTRRRRRCMVRRAGSVSRIRHRGGDREHTFGHANIRRQRRLRRSLRIRRPSADLAVSSATSSHIRRSRRTRPGAVGSARGVAPLASGGARGRGLNRGSSWGRRQRRFDPTDGSSWLMTSS